MTGALGGYGFISTSNGVESVPLHGDAPQRVYEQAYNPHPWIATA